MYDRITEGALSIGDLVAHLDRFLDDDDELSEALIPEVWEVARKEAAGTGREHAEERRYYLRIQVLREIATGLKQRIGLEPWGRIQIEYLGLRPTTDFITTWSERIGVEPQRLVDGIAALLDRHRRRLQVWDRGGEIFSRYWADGDREIQRGYLPRMRGVPKGVKLQRSETDDRGRLDQWLSGNRQTLIREAALAWGVAEDQVTEFIEGLWRFLTDDLQLLASVTLKGSRGRALPGCSGARQIDSDRLLIAPHTGRWRCGRCRRTQIRPTPNDACLAWRCDGRLHFEEDDPDDYDLRTLEEGFAMLRPYEHSAQVPNRRREELEELFKGDGESVNTLVCTPTLELGVDIGGLDTVLLRNVPPLPSNYWQRVGRAGRRHRLAVNITYARPTTHDRAYFADPLKLLRGRVEPPRFNLRNEVMVDKHVRAAAITRLYQLAQEDSGLSEFDRAEIEEGLRHAFPRWIRDYLFDEAGLVRSDIYDISCLRMLVTKHEQDLIDFIVRTFTNDWPTEDQAVVDPQRLRVTVLEMPNRLEEVLRTFKRRLDWALSQVRRLSQELSDRGTLEPDENQLFNRCRRLIDRLKGVAGRRRGEAEGYDDTYTLSALAAEGFLPGYGLEVGSVIGIAQMPRWTSGEDFTLPRAPAMALREYVPGNLIYANGHRFVPRFFHFDVGEGRIEPIRLRVDVEHGAVSEVGTPRPEGSAMVGAQELTAVTVTDADLTHTSRITDDEEYRFQLPVAVEGYERNRHGEGTMYDWGGRDVSFRRGVHLRLVNLGASMLVRQGRLGYPLSPITGQSRSPLASDTELDNFNETQLRRYGRPIEWMGFYADSVADTLLLQRCADREEAYSLLEALRIGMAQVLDMEREDLQLLAIGTPGVDEVDGLVYDPMPGGSGLLEQAIDRWGQVIAAATEVLSSCESACDRSCQDCMWTYRNAYIHRFLDRHRGLALLGELGDGLEFRHEIASRLPTARPDDDDHTPVNAAEERLKQLLESAGLTDGSWQHEIDLGMPHGRTVPDVYFDRDGDQVCVYLDGLSEHIHGNPRTQAKDRQIRELLRSRHYWVFEIPATHLYDREEIAGHLSRLVRVLEGKDAARAIRDSKDWYTVDEPPTRKVADDLLEE
jgi:hypothetical protein